MRSLLQSFNTPAAPGGGNVCIFATRPHLGLEILIRSTMNLLNSGFTAWLMQVMETWSRSQ
jgi:hypothetical protein